MSCVAAASVRTALVVGVVLLGVVGCGGNGDGDGGSDSAASSPGAKVFADAGCGNCHTMEAADATGTTGPSLDDLKPEKARVARQVKNGGVGMPSFQDELSAEQIDQVAEFVSNETRKATGGGSVAAGFKPDDTKVEDCAEDDFHCFEQAFANIAYNDGRKPPSTGSTRTSRRPGRSSGTVTASFTRSAPARSHTTTATSARHSSPAARAARRATTTGSSSGRSSASPKTNSGPPRAGSVPMRRSGRPSSSRTSASTASATA